MVNQRVTLSQLKGLGYTADVASDGEVALQMMAQTTYDIVLMDCQMPKLDGYSTTHAIRRLEGQRRRTIIIALTANAMKQDRDQCLAAGMDDYLSKPLPKDVLATKLTHWSQVLRSRHQTAASSVMAPVASPTPQQAMAIQTDTIAASHTEANASQPLSHVMNWEHLHQLSDGNEAFERELLHIFVEDVGNHLAHLKTAIADGNFHAIEHTAHHIKGASANVGLAAMSAIAAAFEQQSCQNQVQDAAARLAQLQRTLDDVQLFLLTN